MKKRREETGVEKGEETAMGAEGKKKRNNKMKEVPSGRWYYEVSLYCRPVVLSVFVFIYRIIK